MTPLEDALAGALVGLASACKNGVKTENTDSVLARALALPDGADEASLRAALEAVRAEKRAVAPNCADCPNPCGATDDYDMALVRSAQDDVREAKLAILSELRAAARAASADELMPADGDALRDALEYVGYDVDADMLRDALGRARALRRRCEGAKGDGLC